MTSPTLDPAERLAAITASLRLRLRPICQTMAEETFLAMVDQMAAIQLKFEMQESEAGVWGKVPEHL